MVKLPLKEMMNNWAMHPAPRVSRQESMLSHTSGIIDVPSDESDPGYAHSPSKRLRRRAARIRQRANLVSVTPQSSTPAPSVITSITDRDRLSLDKRRLSFETNLESKQGSDSDKQSSSSSNPADSPRRPTIEESLKLRLAYFDDLFDPQVPNTMENPPSLRSRNAVAGSNFAKSTAPTNTSNSVDGMWTILSIWVPGLKEKLVCTNGNFHLIDQKTFLRRILEIEKIAEVNTLHDISGHHLTTLQISHMNETNNEISTEMRSFGSSPPQTSNIIKEKVTFEIVDLTVRTLLFTVASQNDLILTLVPGCNTNYTNRFLIHLTTRQCDTNVQLNKFRREASTKWVIDRSGGHHYKYGHVTVLSLLSVAAGVAPPATERELVGVNASSGGGIEGGTGAGASRDANINNPVIDNDNNHMGATQGGGVTGMCNGEVPMDVDEEVNNNANNETSLPVLNAAKGLDFNLERFIQEGRLLPGPMRPEIQKTSSTEYTYDKLVALKDKLRAQIEKERNTTKMIPATIGIQCSVYGVVTDVTEDDRTNTAYLVRITDDSLTPPTSVLIRLSQSKGIKGPQIQVGDIIRVHRVKAQIEYDRNVKDHTLVLSTFQHQNYVVFRPSSSGDLQFEYQSCAKTMTLSEYDNTRVEELHAYKLAKLNDAEAECMEGIQECSRSNIKDNNINNTHQQRPEMQQCQPSTSKDINAHRPESRGFESEDLNSSPQSPIQLRLSVDDPLNLGDDISCDELHVEIEAITNQKSKKDNQKRVVSAPISASSPKTTTTSNTFHTACDLSPIRAVNAAVNPSGTSQSISPGPSSLQTRSKRANHAAISQKIDKCVDAGIGVDRAVVQFQSQINSASSANDSNLPKLPTYFMYLNRDSTNSNPTLMVKLLGLKHEKAENKFHLIIIDGEETVPPAEFVNTAGIRHLGLQKANSCLILNITNAACFGRRRKLNYQIFNSLQTNDLYIIENVSIKGIKPPYNLEVDGANCVIRLATPADWMGQSQQTFDEGQHSALNNNCLIPLERPNSPEPVVTPENSLSASNNELDATTILLPKRKSPRIASHEKQGHNNNVTAADIEQPDTTPVKRKSKDKSTDASSSARKPDKPEPWTGRLKTRRQPRRHFQCETSFK